MCLTVPLRHRVASLCNDQRYHYTLFLAPRILDPYSENKAVSWCHLPQKSPVHHLKETGIEAKQNERKKRGRSLQILTDSGLKHGELLEQSTLASWSPAQRKGHRDGRPGDLPRSRVPVPSCWKPRGRRVRVHIRQRGLHLAFREFPYLLSSTHPPCSCASSSAFPSSSFLSSSCLFLLPAHVSFSPSLLLLPSFPSSSNCSLSAPPPPPSLLCLVLTV